MLNYYAYKKLVISGNVAELYEYECPLVKGIFRNKLGRKNEKNTNSATKEENRKKTQTRARKQVARLINSNALEMRKFLTLTFAENITNIKVANHYFKTFVQRVNYYLKKQNKPKIKYVAVIEFQKRGAIHYHLLCNLPYIANSTLTNLWRNGFIRINQIENIDNVGAYVTKYMNKDLSDTRLQGQKCYLTSKNLDKSIKITDEDTIYSLLPQFDIIRKYKTNYTSEYNGNVVYTQYILKSDIKKLYNEIYERNNLKNIIMLYELPNTQSFRKPFSKGLLASNESKFEYQQLSLQKI